MTSTADRQLGAELRRLKPAGAAPQALQSMVRDLVGADQSLLAPLLHLLTQPAFLALDPLDSSSAVRVAVRDSLLQELAETYHPRLLQRLGDFLDGYLDLPSHEGAVDDALPQIDEKEPAPSPDKSSLSSPGFVSQALTGAPPAAPQSSAVSSSHQDSVMDPWGSAPTAERAALGQGSAADPLVSAVPTSATVAPPPPEAWHSESRRPLAILAAAGLGLVVSLSAGLAALRHPQLCNLFGTCESPKRSSPASSSSERALQAGEAAMRAMQKAADLPSYRKALEELDIQLLRLSGDPLDADQLRRRDRLQERFVQGQARLKQETSDAAVVSEARKRIDALPSQPAASAEATRSQIRRSLAAIPPNSFSHREAQSELQRLDATPAPSEPTPDEPSEPARSPDSPSAAPKSAPTPPPMPRSPERRRDDSGSTRSGSGGSWSAPRRPTPAPAPTPAPTPAPPRDDGEGNAPYRAEPLF